MKCIHWLGSTRPSHTFHTAQMVRNINRSSLLFYCKHNIPKEWANYWKAVFSSVMDFGDATVWNLSCVMRRRRRRRRDGCVAVTCLLLHTAPTGGEESLQICDLLLWQAESCAEANLIWIIKANSMLLVSYWLESGFSSTVVLMIAHGFLELLWAANVGTSLTWTEWSRTFLLHRSVSSLSIA